ncbi:MAG: hypothetical protein LBQ31_00985 [Bacteroidales bacterium]|jgi:hypothetical protein|nr:hypothetical protein [Bacteroidales bacterium]
MRKEIISLLFLMPLSISLLAQWECPSRLGGSLRQIGESNFMWGVELTGGAGYISNSLIFNQMSLFGLNYSNARHTIYIEGGFKTWYEGDYDLRIKSSTIFPGLREAFYHHTNSLGSLTLGLQSLLSDDLYLVNERVLGLSHKKSFPCGLNINLFTGTVSKHFARNGTFCNLAYLYDILPYINQPLLGESLGQTNLAGLTVGYRPSAKDDEFSDDGLGVEKSRSLVNIETVGLVLYGEFGSWIKPPAVMGGVYANIEIGNGYGLKPELLYAAGGNAGLIYCAKFEKSSMWQNAHRTVFSAAYYGTFNADNGQSGSKNKNKSSNSFSNILAGTVLRFDTPDMPFYMLSVKHTIPKLKTHLKIQYVGQTKTNPNTELDMEIGKKFFNKLLINASYGYVNSPELLSNPNLFRLEMRFNF